MAKVVSLSGCDKFSCSMTHSVDERPKFKDLLEDPFIKFIESQHVDVAGWYGGICEKEKALLEKTKIPQAEAKVL